MSTHDVVIVFDNKEEALETAKKITEEYGIVTIVEEGSKLKKYKKALEDIISAYRRRSDSYIKCSQMRNIAQTALKPKEKD